jgi:hypothetical protein
VLKIRGAKLCLFAKSVREGRAGRCLALLRKKMGGGKLLYVPPGGGHVFVPSKTYRCAVPGIKTVGYLYNKIHK